MIIAHFMRVELWHPHAGRIIAPVEIWHPHAGRILAPACGCKNTNLNGAEDSNWQPGYCENAHFQLKDRQAQKKQQRLNMKGGDG